MDLSVHGRIRDRLRLAAWRSRFVVAAVCCGLAAWTTVDAVRPAPPVIREVLVTARALDGGQPLGADDVTTVRVDAGLAPGALLDGAADVAGSTAAVDLPAGTPLSPALLRRGGPAAAAPPGSVVVAVRLTESDWLRPGDRVDLVATDDDGTRLARRAEVLPPPDEGAGADDEAGGGLLGSATGGAADPVTLLAVSPQEAAAVSAASGWGAVAPVLVP
ncbi:SAF domain-containing protein [Isoptericola haloaureus]|uniref:SAF domain-containing protein n=1 Tax=Isoptericola haloaureus TaxID=1542902 RepID=A0ABU7Z4V8_9MICO